MSRRAPGNDLIDLAGEIRHETERAFLFWDGTDKKPVWLPKSLCKWDEQSREMTMPEWIAIEKGLI